MYSTKLRLSLSEIEDGLTRLPQELHELEARQHTEQQLLAEATAQLDLARINAALGAPADGKNAEDRKLQREQAISNSPDVKDARTEITVRENNAGALEIQITEKRRTFAALCHIAEMRANEMRLQATGQETNP